LVANQNQSFQGSNILGLGFTMSPDAARELIEKNPLNKEVLFPCLNGEDLNSSPDQSPSRWIINFKDWPLNRTASGKWNDLDSDERERMLQTGSVTLDYPHPVAADYPDCLSIAERDVKPERDRLASGDATARDRARRWWQFARPTIRLYEATADLPQMLVRAAVTSHNCIALCPTKLVPTHAVIVFASNRYSLFCILQSTIHTDWFMRFGSTLETRLRYTPSDCFETFPLPQFLGGLEDIGNRYYRRRSEIMFSRKQGLTATYNRFHDDDNRDADILDLRRIHVEMDQAMVAAYGWQDLDLCHGFHPTKQGVRFTIAENARRTVLDRLVKLNHERYADEVAAGEHDKSRKTRRVSKKKPAHPLFQASIEP
jgi:hypothetical protein